LHAFEQESEEAFEAVYCLRVRVTGLKLFGYVNGYVPFLCNAFFAKGNYPTLLETKRFLDLCHSGSNLDSET
jgi:hypothetical protein